MKYCSLPAFKRNLLFGLLRPAMAALAVAGALPAAAQLSSSESFHPTVPSTASAGTTSALAILRQVPKVHFEDPPPPAERNARIGIVSSRTNESFDSQSFDSGSLDYAGPGSSFSPTPVPRATPRLTPRPTPTPKMGILKRSIRAIPLLGPRIISDGSREGDRDAEDEENLSGPGVDPVVEPEPDSVFLPPPAERVNVQPPAPGQQVTNLDSTVPESAVPPIYSAGASATDTAPDARPGATEEPVAPLLRPFPEDAPGLTPTPLLTPSSYYVPKTPSAETRMEPATVDEARAPRLARTPDPLLRTPVTASAADETDSAAPYASTATGHEESNHVVVATPSHSGSSDAYESEAPAESPAAYAPAAVTPQATAATAFPSAVAAVTSPTLEPTDLNFPNPAVEDNEVLREKYSEAVLAGRGGDYARAARLFREYATHHALSRLAPRALFLASILEPDPAQSAEDARNLETQFPDSKYVPELRRRRAAMGRTAPDAADGGAEARPEHIPTLETQLASGLPAAQEVTVRRRLGQALIMAENYDRALQVLIPALQLSAGTAEEAEILLLISDAAIAKRDADQAARALDQLVRRHPEAARRPRVRLNQGLLFEETGSYQRARSVYNALLEESPQTPEAELARERLRDLRML